MADEQITSNTANIPFVNLINVGSDQAAPSAGRAILYIKSGVAYVRLDTGAPVAIGGAVALPEGRLAIGDGSGELSALALGTEGQLVTADASGFATWDDPPAGGGGGSSFPILVASNYLDSSTGASVTYLASSLSPGGALTNRVSWANADSLTYKLWLEAGTYTLKSWFRKLNVGGIVDATIGGVSAGSADTYNSTQVDNIIFTHTGVVLASGGVKDLVYTVNGKNASSTGYASIFQGAVLWRTA